MRLIEVDPKIGRNDPCHCRSGRKYKKCCLESDGAKRIVNPASTRREMESVMKKIGKIFESKNMPIDDMNNYFANRSLDDISAEYEDLGELTPKERAEELLSESRLSMAQIARQLGFAEQSSFTRACRRWFGDNPRRVKRQGTFPATS